jgi:hypothetical protein
MRLSAHASKHSVRVNAQFCRDFSNLAAAADFGCGLRSETQFSRHLRAGIGRILALVLQ